MKLYYIDTKAIATKENTDFAAQTREYWYGRNKIRIWKDDEPKSTREYMLKEYGFKTKAAANKALESRKVWDEYFSKDGLWNFSSVVMGMEVQK